MNDMHLKRRGLIRLTMAWQARPQERKGKAKLRPRHSLVSRHVRREA
jgi:hypothetical protein